MHITAFVHTGTLDKTSALCLGAILNNAITNKKHRNAKNVALSRMQRGHLFTMWQQKTWKQEPPSSTTGGKAHMSQLKFFAALCMSINGCETVVSSDFGFTEIAGIHPLACANNEAWQYKESPIK